MLQPPQFAACCLLSSTNGQKVRLLQWLTQTKWHNKRLAVIELGCGRSVHSLRFECQELLRTNYLPSPSATPAFSSSSSSSSSSHASTSVAATTFEHVHLIRVNPDVTRVTIPPPALPLLHDHDRRHDMTAPSLPLGVALPLAAKAALLAIERAIHQHNHGDGDREIGGGSDRWHRVPAVPLRYIRATVTPHHHHHMNAVCKQWYNILKSS